MTSLRAESLGGIVSPVGGAKTASDGHSSAASTQPTTIQEKDALTALKAEIMVRLGLDGDLHLSFAQPWGSLPAPETGDWKLVVTQLPSTGLSSTTLVRFRIDAAGQTLGEWQTFLRAQLWRPVWVASRRLDRGAILDDTVCTVQSVDILREKQSLVPAETDLSLYRMAQTLSQERPLAWRDIALQPLVRKGDVIDVLVNKGALQISMKGTAMSDAGKDERVRVRNMDSRNDFTARVVRSNTVTVEF